jgi:hypothetical protein
MVEVMDVQAEGLRKHGNKPFHVVCIPSLTRLDNQDHNLFHPVDIREWKGQVDWNQWLCVRHRWFVVEFFFVFQLFG